jgi:hypothetical protein
MKVALTVALLALSIAPIYGQGESAPATGAYALTVNYDRPGLNVPHWQIKITPHFPAEYTGKPMKGVDPGIVFFALSDAGSAKLGDLLARSHDLQPCESKTKGLANMGQKSVEYAPVGGTAVKCSYNYTENKPLSEAMDYMLGIVDTVQTGTELERLHRYDRLGLDAAMIQLLADAKAGHAVELGAIRPTLQTLIADVALLDRVRAHAQQLLDMADPKNPTQ